MLIKFVVLVFLIGFVSAVDVDFYCPDEIYVGEEFECEVEISDGEEEYDLKIEVDKERDSVLRIFCEERDWISGYYYLTDFVRDDEVVRLKIEETGKFDIVVKLRYGEWRKEFDVGRIRVEEREAEGEEDSPQVSQTDMDLGEREKGEENDVIYLGEDVVVLGSEVVENEEKWDYVSKDGKIVDWLLYGFCLFLIFLIGILVVDRF